MTQERIERHLDISDLLMRWANDEFETGEPFLASEMTWGAVAHFLKSVAKYRGWPNETHRDLNDIASDLAYETGDRERIGYLYESVNQLHVNFYEDWLLDSQVSDHMNDAKELID
jgi:hypothetical protein